MKFLLILTLAAALPGCLAGCVTDAATGRRTLSPEMQAAANRIGVTALTAAEAALIARLHDQLRVRPSSK